MIYLQKDLFNEVDFQDDFLSFSLKHTEFFSNYLKRIKKERTTEALANDIQFHLWQLMRIYLNLKIVLKFYCLKKSEKSKFYKILTNRQKLYDYFYAEMCKDFNFKNLSSKQCAYTNFHYLTATKDFCDFIMPRVIKCKRLNTQKIIALLSILLNKICPLNLKVFSRNECIKINTLINDYTNYNFVSGKLYRYSYYLENYEVEEIDSNCDFYLTITNEAVNYFSILNTHLIDICKRGL